ncbi:CatB-related O-acetyltransferase [Neobacillus sp. PS2-9]|uniref:CatB-related O-acetyltransferase n=1 Tax=Neobacillus sp. PS2-9 TaxID=3070676 RepID=UPI0027E0ACFE|nr:CatB-related O-acetyltransferase [Neobacillus sp. PS2-9]WML58623.1 CatB-related O-acetyltransferase [Neobacillus sp. PS2-9]
MINMIDLIWKIIHRLSRIMTGKMGVYARELGKNNKFTKGVLIQETASIGKYNYFGPYTMVNNSKVGNYCSFGPGVKIGQGEHSKEYITTYQKISGNLIGHSLNISKTEICNDVWCGANVVIKQGIKVGNGAVIGANAVVTHDVPPYAIVVGAPAKIIKYRFSSEKIDLCVNSGWFYHDLKDAKKIIKDLEKEFTL